jgi:hypothetical protein
MNSEAKPTIGRIVLYTLPAHLWQYVAEDDRVRPAVVTRVITDTAVNLRVLTDPTDIYYLPVRDQTHVEQGIGTAGRWHWPSRS